ncbi:hypothetical protein PCASD_18010 [Puccinia coronata f. sp. avenae]|uniref:CxC1-like cysteine cluster associated with KDZ transposases domain-containing protein n=1 Tax=Puccinia coronata f. sp. avenae TaxID=200324 RepID=A0A2N5UC52_9BASI|nr:hypothetical protein PCASD_18010 [Puccinia coronata f. sp. avenae]
MTLTVDQTQPHGSRTQRLRRMVNAKRIAASRARLLGLQRRRRLAAPQVPNNDSFNQEDFHFEDPGRGSNSPEQDREDNWVTLIPVEPDDFDHAVYADRKRWRQEAKDINWDSVMKKLHAYFMDLKARTNNWTDSNSYSDFVTCNCAPHICYQRTVDMVDLFGALPFTTTLKEWLEPRSERLFVRRKKHASRDYRPLQTPCIFLKPEEFTQADNWIQAKEIELSPPSKVDRCADSNKAADDKRNESTWKGCDNTGLMGCCCRHDAAIYMGNIYKSGKQRCLPVAILTLARRYRRYAALRHATALLAAKDAIFAARRAVAQHKRHSFVPSTLRYATATRELLHEHRGCLKFGTSVFHAYVHNWLCQLDYNPRFNIGWGLSDGEGLERLWSYLSPLISPLRYATRNHRLASIAHCLAHHNRKSIRKLPVWLAKKFNSAILRHQDASAVLSGLAQKRNCHLTSGVNYEQSFFKQQWEAQRLFQKEHTEAEDGLRQKLVTSDLSLSPSRERLRGPEIFLATQDEQDELLDTIAEKFKELRKQVDEIASNGLMSSVANDEEAKLRLLLWDAKATLFVQAVHIQAERWPIVESKTMGGRLGTKLKEKIFKALQNRSPAVKKVINSYNRFYLNYIKKFPNKRLGNAEDYPLTYKNFVRFPIDHRFWNNGLYYHSKAPWATDPDELCRAMGWGVSYYNSLENTMGYISGRIIQLDGDLEVPDNHVDMIGWLWDQCQPDSSRTYKLDWDEMMDHIQRGSPIDPAVFEGVNELREETVLDINLDDGEDAEDANDSNDPEDY